MITIRSPRLARALKLRDDFRRSVMRITQRWNDMHQIKAALAALDALEAPPMTITVIAAMLREQVPAILMDIGAEQATVAATEIELTALLDLLPETEALRFAQLGEQTIDIALPQHLVTAAAYVQTSHMHHALSALVSTASLVTRRDAIGAAKTSEEHQRFATLSAAAATSMREAQSVVDRLSGAERQMLRETALTFGATLEAALDVSSSV